MGKLEPAPKQNHDHDQQQEVSPSLSSSSNGPTIAAPPPPHTPHTQLISTSHDEHQHQQPTTTLSSPYTHDGLVPNNQLVVYVPLEQEQHVGGQGSSTGLTKRQGSMSRDDDDLELMPAVQFPPRREVHAPPQNVGGGTGGGGVEMPMDVIIRRMSLMRAQSHTQTQPRQTPVTIVQAVGNPWSSGLFDCFQNPTNAIITVLAPFVTFGQIAEVVDSGSTSCLTGSTLYVLLFLVVCHWNIGIRYRRRVRNAFNLSETPVTDRISHAMFPLCALCQEFRELDSRGLDPFLGYKGIIAKYHHEQMQLGIMSNNPPMSQFMMR